MDPRHWIPHDFKVSLKALFLANLKAFFLSGNVTGLTGHFFLFQKILHTLCKIYNVLYSNGNDCGIFTVTQQTITCFKSRVGTLEVGVTYIQS